MASFLFRQSPHRKGPCHGVELMENIEPAWTEIPSFGARSAWQTAHTKRPPVCAVGSSFPSLPLMEKEDKICKIFMMSSHFQTHSNITLEDKSTDYRGCLLWTILSSFDHLILQILSITSYKEKRKQVLRSYTDLSASMADPSSNNSSTIPTADSFFANLLVDFQEFFLKNRALSLLYFLGGGEGGGLLSGGITSTTMQVVSSLSPRDLNASYTIPIWCNEIWWSHKGWFTIGTNQDFSNHFSISHHIP